jgi:GT2 family glycosyltransferase
MSARLSIVIVTWNNEREVRDCLAPLRGLPGGWEVWVVDNASEDRTAAIVRDEFPWVRLIENAENVGFARANNQVIARTDSEYVLLLNPDAVSSAGALDAALGALERHPAAGVLAVQLRNPDGSLQPSCFRFPSPLVSLLTFGGAYLLLPRGRRGHRLLAGWWDHAEARPVDWVLGAFMLVRREAIERAGPLPEEHFLFGEDMAWCRRMWAAGYEVRFDPVASVVHAGNRSASRRPAEWRAELTHRAKYSFCYANYGPAWTRLIQLADLAGYTLRRLRYGVGRRADARARYLSMARGQRAAWREIRRPVGGRD